ncbi:MAG: hypothetical protein ACYTFW_00200 [Planctomycetota bacterium]
MTTIDVLEVYILSEIDYENKEIGFVGHARAEGYGVPHPGTAPHPGYAGSLHDSMAFYRVDQSEYLVWSCEAIVLTFDSGTSLLYTYQKLGYNIRQTSVSELKRRNALYRQSTWRDD